MMIVNQHQIVMMISLMTMRMMNRYYDRSRMIGLNQLIMTTVMMDNIVEVESNACTHRDISMRAIILIDNADRFIMINERSVPNNDIHHMYSRW